MSSNNSDALTNSVKVLTEQFPGRQELIERVQSLVAQLERDQSINQKRRELTLSRLYDEIEPASTGELAKVLSILIGAGVLEKLFRVESPSLGGIDDFHSLTDIPSVIFDPHTDQELKVTPSNLKIIFRLAPR